MVFPATIGEMANTFSFTFFKASFILLTWRIVPIETIGFDGLIIIFFASLIVEALMKVGRKLPYELKETGLGGIAATKTGKRIKKSLYKS